MSWYPTPWTSTTTESLSISTTVPRSRLIIQTSHSVTKPRQCRCYSDSPTLRVSVPSSKLVLKTRLGVVRSLLGATLLAPKNTVAIALIVDQYFRNSASRYCCRLSVSSNSEFLLSSGRLTGYPLGRRGQLPAYHDGRPRVVQQFSWRENFIAAWRRAPSCFVGSVRAICRASSSSSMRSFFFRDLFCTATIRTA
jgi:hypothetical protein